MKKIASVFLLFFVPFILLADQVVVTKQTARIRAEANGKSSVVTTVHKGDILELADPAKAGHFYHVTVNNQKGYIYQTSVSTSPGTTSGLSNNNYYTNVDGNQVHSPAYSNGVPPGATCRCNDGTYSFSQHRRGSCSHHGGVAEWLQ